MSFGDLLAAYALRMTEIIRLLDEFLNCGKPFFLYSAAYLLTELGSEMQASFAEYGQAILAALSIDAGMRLKERALNIEKRGLRDADLEYVTEVRDLLKRMVSAIESGEYERSYEEMVKKHAQ